MYRYLICLIYFLLFIFDKQHVKNSFYLVSISRCTHALFSPPEDSCYCVEGNSTDISLKKVQNMKWAKLFSQEHVNIHVFAS